MTGASRAPRSNRNIVVALFNAESAARETTEAVGSLGVDHRQVGLLRPGQSTAASDATTGEIGDALAEAASATDGKEIADVLVNIGVPDGEARFYAQEARDGRTLVVVNADGRADEVRRVMLEHGGYDVQSRGRELIRPRESGVR